MRGASSPLPAPSLSSRQTILSPTSHSTSNFPGISLPLTALDHASPPHARQGGAEDRTLPQASVRFEPSYFSTKEAGDRPLVPSPGPPESVIQSESRLLTQINHLMHQVRKGSIMLMQPSLCGFIEMLAWVDRCTAAPQAESLQRLGSGTFQRSELTSQLNNLIHRVDSIWASIGGRDAGLAAPGTASKGGSPVHTQGSPEPQDPDPDPSRDLSMNMMMSAISFKRGVAGVVSGEASSAEVTNSASTHRPHFLRGTGPDLDLDLELAPVQIGSRATPFDVAGSREGHAGPWHPSRVDERHHEPHHPPSVTRPSGTVLRKSASRDARVAKGETTSVSGRVSSTSVTATSMALGRTSEIDVETRAAIAIQK